MLQHFLRSNSKPYNKIWKWGMEKMSLIVMNIKSKLNVDDLSNLLINNKRREIICCKISASAYVHCISTKVIKCSCILK